MFVGIALLIIGLVALAIKLGYIQGSIWGWVWPLLLIAVGLSFMMRRSGGGWCCGGWRRHDGEEHKP